MSEQNIGRLKRRDRDYVIDRLENWGGSLARSTNVGYPARSPLVDMIEYRTRVSAGYKRLDHSPNYQRDQWNSTTNAVVCSLPDELYQILFFRFGYHQVIHQIPEANLAPDSQKTKLSAKQIADCLSISRRTLSRRYTDALKRVYGGLVAFSGMRGVNRPCADWRYRRLVLQSHGG